MPSPSTNPPELVATIGLHASASTWVYNIARELLIAELGANCVLAFYAERISDFPAESLRNQRHLVIKSQHGSEELDDLLRTQDACLVLSIRDPRDAVISMVQRFGADANHAVKWLVNDCRRLIRISAKAAAIFRYEEAFFKGPAAIEQIAAQLRIAPTPEHIGRIELRYRTETVKAFAESLATSLTAERRVESEFSTMDRVTQIHSVHIGDGRVGKWKDLPVAEREFMTQAFLPFLQRFDYPV